MKKDSGYMLCFEHPWDTEYIVPMRSYTGQKAVKTHSNFAKLTANTTDLIEANRCIIRISVNEGKDVRTTNTQALRHTLKGKIKCMIRPETEQSGSSLLATCFDECGFWSSAIDSETYVPSGKPAVD